MIEMIVARILAVLEPQGNLSNSYRRIGISKTRYIWSRNRPEEGRSDNLRLPPEMQGISKPRENLTQ
jgi:hypothetical protein